MRLTRENSRTALWSFSRLFVLTKDVCRLSSFCYNGRMKKILGITALIVLTSCQTAKHKPDSLGTVYDFETLPEIGKSEAGEVLFLGGFSGLFYSAKESTSGRYVFYTHTDRGPNFESMGHKRPFALPQFQPRIVRFELNPNGKMARITSTVLLKQKDGKPVTGISNHFRDEFPVDESGKEIPLDKMGIDPEGLVRLPNGDFWMAEEYRPSLVQFSANGRMIERYVPEGNPKGEFGDPALPSILSQRLDNRGFEGLTYFKGRLYAFMQSSLVKDSTLIRVLEFDPHTRKTTGMFLYRMEGNGSDKIGDASTDPAGKKIFALERDSKRGVTSQKKIFELDFSKATNILKLGKSAFPACSLEVCSEADLTSSAITLIEKKRVVDLAKTSAAEHEKLEGLAVLSDGSFMIVNDNDFALNGGTEKPQVFRVKTN